MLCKGQHITSVAQQAWGGEASAIAEVVGGKRQSGFAIYIAHVPFQTVDAGYVVVRPWKSQGLHQQDRQQQPAKACCPHTHAVKLV